LKDIVAETNRYAMEEDDHGDTRGGPAWRNLTVPKLKAFIAASFLMDLKKQPNNKSYWSKEGSFFHCPRISKMFTCDRFQELLRCLHLTNPTNYDEDIMTSPMHLEYTTHMRGVDVADQSLVSYSCQTRSHKWWPECFTSYRT
jgi:hypothetical protein